MKTSARSPALLLSLLVLATTPTMAQANAGTPLMWFEAFHMIMGNALIGLLEGTILALVFKLRWVWTISVMILANYVSALMGAIWVLNGTSASWDLDITNGWMFVWKMVAITFLWTLVLELPFVLFAFPSKGTRLFKALLGNLLVQTISYSILVFCYFRFCATSLYTDCQVVHLGDLDLPAGVTVAFISKDDGQIYLGELTRQNWQKEGEWQSRSFDERLVVQKPKNGSGMGDLVVLLQASDYFNTNWKLVKKAFAQGQESTESSPNDPSRPARGTLFNFGDALRLGSAQESSWHFSTDFWYSAGLRGGNRQTGQTVHLAFETPFACWTIRNVTHLPGDLVLLQIGWDQICLYDPVGKKLALLAKGRGPVAVVR